MGTLQITLAMLECDGCGTWFGEEKPFSNPMEARAAAYSAGWRFPHHVGTKGRMINSTSDVCPSCVPSWTPQPRSHRIRNLTQDELARRAAAKGAE